VDGVENFCSKQSGLFEIFIPAKTTVEKTMADTEESRKDTSDFYSELVHYLSSGICRVFPAHFSSALSNDKLDPEYPMML
jgi:hypothetical protein